MTSLAQWLKTIFAVDALKTLVFLISLLFVLLVARAVIPPSWRIMRTALFHGQPMARWSTFKELCLCFLYVLQTRSVLQTARLRVECEILNPRPAPPPPVKGSRRERAAARREHRDSRREWRHNMRSTLSVLVQQFRTQRPEITVHSCFDLLTRPGVADGIKRYFTALAVDRSPDVGPRNQFLSSVRIEKGFLAPTHLVTGLLAHFNQNWEPILDEYGASLYRENDFLTEGSRKLQLFWFDCWLLWGPSIPVCTCTQWNGSVALQYGYGDENNSLYLLVTDQKALQEIVAPDASCTAPCCQDRSPRGVFAFPASITGTLRASAGLDTIDICPAQQGLRDTDFFLEYEKHRRTGGEPAATVAAYYSAYLWVAFVICEADGKPARHPADTTDEKWRRLLTFFEHGNIADAPTYDFLQRQLAVKAARGLRKLVELEGDREWTYTYVCAFDHSGCGDPLRFPAVERTTRDAVAEELAAPEYDAIRGRVELGLTYDWQPWYSSCHLPEIVEQYYAHARSGHRTAPAPPGPPEEGAPRE